jgi:DNA-binding MarR family transcriptional regulator/GNAT superfamily N-acetyltransferase
MNARRYKAIAGIKLPDQGQVMDASQIARVRSFNRLVTRRVDALADSYLDRGRPLGEARVIFEIGSSGGIQLQRLRRLLGLDSGYLSRLLRSLERQGLLELHTSAGDGRSRVAVLTQAGRDEFDAYNAASDARAASILAPLPSPHRDRLVGAMREVERLLLASAVQVAAADIASPEVQTCLDLYCAELAERVEGGFDPASGNGLDPATATPPNGWIALARLDGEPVGCGVLRRLSPGVGEIKRVWTSRSVRGLGVATRIMEWLESTASEAGLATLRLDTNRALTEAQAMYRASGWRQIDRYNDNPYADHFFEKNI